MAEDLEISRLPEITSAGQTDPLPVVNGGVTSRITKANYLNLDTDGTLSGNSDTRIASQKATKTYSDTKQPLDGELTAIAGLTSAANKIPYFTGSQTAGMLDFKDEDTFTSDSATAVPSQQSVKINFSSLFNVKAYGAAGNDSTDDTTAIQAALDAAEAAGGGTIVFPYGTYVCTTLNTPSNVHWKALGCSGENYLYGTRIKLKANTAASLINMDNATSVKFEGIRFDGNKANQTTGGRLIDGSGYSTKTGDLNIQFIDCVFSSATSTAHAVAFDSGYAGDGLITNVSFDRCRFTNNDGGAFSCTKLVWGRFNDCNITDNARGDNVGVIRFNNSNCHITNCDVEGNTGVNIKLIGGAQVANTSIICHNNFEAGALIILDISGCNSKVLVNDNVANTSGGTFCQFTACSGFTCNDNYALGSTGNGYGCRVTGNSQIFNIQNNVFTGGFYDGISLDLGTMNYYIVTGNNSTDGVVDAGGGANKVVDHNL